MKRQKSLLLRLLLLVIVMILVPSLLTFAVFFRTIPDRMEEQAEANADFYIGQVADSVGASMELARDVAFNAIADGSLRRHMSDMEAYLGAGGQGDLARVVGGVADYQSAWDRRAIKSVYLFRRDGAFTFYSPGGSFAPEQRRMQQIWESQAASSARTLFCVAGAPEDCLYFLLDYKNIDNLDLLGKLIIEIDAPSMASAEDLEDLYPGACLALSGAEGQVLYARGDEARTLLTAAREDGGAYVRNTADDSRYYHAQRQIGDYELRLDIFIPLRAMYNVVWESSQIFLVLSGVILAVTALAALCGYRVLRGFLGRMEQALASMAESDYTARLPSSGYRELARFEEAFNSMADNLDSSFQDAYQKGIQLQESESRLLAAQINPHFIFNVLEAVNMRCVDAGLKDLSRMVTDLAQLLRGNIGVGSSSQKISFAQELSYVRYYLDLQRERFGKGLSYSVEYEDEEILRYQVPRLTVQPLVENAIVHGLEPRRGLGTVSVRIWEEDQSVCVRVEDDGVGFEPERMDSARREDATLHNHIALPNIRRRLDLLYGSRASLTIDSAPGRGTTVLLTLPIDETEV